MTTPEATTAPKATLGRVVIAQGLDPNLNGGMTEAPAIITRVWGRSGRDNETGGWTVNAKVIPNSADNAWGGWLPSIILFDDRERAARWCDEERVRHGDGHGPVFLVWPERV